MIINKYKEKTFQVNKLKMNKKSINLDNAQYKIKFKQ